MSLVMFVIVDFPRDRVPVVLAPLLYPETLDLPVAKLGVESATVPFTVCISYFAVGYVILTSRISRQCRGFTMGDCMCV